MLLTRRTASVARIVGDGARPRVHLRPAASSSSSTPSTPARAFALAAARGLTPRLVGRRWRTTPAPATALVDQRQGRASAPPRSRCVLGTLLAFAVQPLPLLRPRRRQPPGHPADRAARHRHRHRAQLRVQTSCGARHQLRAVHGDRRSRDVLHRRRVQQRASPGCGGSGTSLEEASMDLGADAFTTFRHVTLPAAALGAPWRARCSPSRCRFDEIVVTHVHRRRRRADPAAVDLRQPVPAQPGAGRQRRRRGPDLAVHHSRVPGSATL